MNYFIEGITWGIGLSATAGGMGLLFQSAIKHFKEVTK